MNRALFSRFMALRRAFSVNSKRLSSGGHHEAGAAAVTIGPQSVGMEIEIASDGYTPRGAVINPGPPVTLDYMAVPFQPYAKVHAELQSKFNTYLAVSSTLFIISIGLALYTDLFAMDAITKPSSYRNRHKNN